MGQAASRPYKYAIVLALAILMALPAGFVIASPEPRGTLPPIAYISTPPDLASFEPNYSIVFDGGQSYDPDGIIINWTWDFGDNVFVNNSPQANHSYPDEGIYNVTLVVWDDDNMTGNTTIKLSIHLNRPPIAIIDTPKNNSELLVGESYAFSAFGSSDPENATLTYLWEFGDGVTSQLAVTDYTYQYPGNYTVRLTAKDPHGLNASASVGVRVKMPNRAPVARIYGPVYGAHYWTNETINFSSHGSYDPDNDPITYYWLFGDGTDGNSESGQHSYGYPGTYTVQLKVEDNQGLSDTASVPIFVERPNARPIAVIASPAAFSTHLVGTEIFFSSLGSYDPDGDDISCTWDFNDGSRNVGKEVGHTFFAPGRYSVTLTVSDGKASGSVQQFFTLVMPNRPPVAVISSPAHTEVYPVNESVLFSANGTNDPDNDSLQCRWDFGDGTYKTGWEVTHVYRQVGNYTVSLTATDPRGLNSSSHLHISVIIPKRMPTASIQVTNPAQFYYVGDTLNLSGSGSTDPDGFPLMFLWSAGKTIANELDRDEDLSYKFIYTGRMSIWLRVSNGEFENMTSLELEVWNRPSVSARVPMDQKNVSCIGGIFIARAGDEIRFAGMGSGGAAELGFVWDFGDGTITNVQNSAHVFSTPGNYTVTLTASDGCSSDSEQLKVTVNPRPGPVVTTNASPAISFGLIAVLLVSIIGFVGFMGGTEIGLYALFSMLFLLYTKMKREELLDNFTRGQIHGYIMANPGTHYSSIRQVLDLNNGTLMYHLKLLEEQKMIKSRPDGMYRRFYPINMKIPEPEAGGLTEIQRMILSKVQETPGITQKDIAGLLSVSASTVNYHTQVLVERNLIRRERSGMWVKYYLQDRSLVQEQSAATSAPPSQ